MCSLPSQKHSSHVQERRANNLHEHYTDYKMYDKASDIFQPTEERIINSLKDGFCLILCSWAKGISVLFLDALFYFFIRISVCKFLQSNAFTVASKVVKPIFF